MPNFPANLQTQVPALQLKPTNLHIMKTQPKPFQLPVSPNTHSHHLKTTALSHDRNEENERLAKIVQEQKAIIHQMQAMLLEERAKNSRHNSSSLERTKKHYTPPADTSAVREDKRDDRGTDLDAMYLNFVKRIKGWERIKQGKSRPPSQTGVSTISRIQDSSRESRDSERTTKRTATKKQTKQKRLKSNDSRISCSSRQARPVRGDSKPREGFKKPTRRKSRSQINPNPKANKTLQPHPKDPKQKQQPRSKPAHPKQPDLASRRVMNHIADLVVDLVGQQLVSKSRPAGKTADRPKKR